MSNPENILAEFQTYSYHHSFIVCNRYETAAQLSTNVLAATFRRSGSDNLYEVRTVEDNPDLQYVILIDTMTDVRISIDSIKWETIVAPKHEAKGGLRYGDTIEVEGEILITESYGIQLYEILANIARDLRRDPSGLVYLLKTTFVGHRSDGSQEVISSVRPFTFNLIDITSSINTGGTSYKLEIIGANNGISKLPQHAQVGEKLSLTIEPGDTVGSMMAKLQTKVQAKYTRYKTEIFQQLLQANPRLTEADLNARFQEVVYTFRADDEYHSDDYVIGGTKGVKESPTIHSGQYGTLETMIRRIIDVCPQCDADGAGRTPNGQKFIHKIVSFPIETNDGRLEVRHEIHRYEAPNQRKNGQPFNPQPGEFIEFDYFYTGRNIDVLNFDIKMDFGLAFFMTLANAKHIPSTTVEDARGIAEPMSTIGSSLVPSNSPVEPHHPDNRELPPNSTPLFIGKKIDDPWIVNKVDPLTAASYDAALTKHAQLEHIEASLTIAGNPNLMDELIDSSGRNRQSREISGEFTGSTGALNITRTPALVRVNVNFPVTNSFDRDGMGVKEFWYRGFYNIYSISNEFKDGLFTQTLMMFSVPVDEEDGIGRSSQTPLGAALPPPGQFPTLPGTICSTDGFPYDIITRFSNNRFITPEFITGVEELADGLETRPEWLLALMGFESTQFITQPNGITIAESFNPAARNESTNATGLIQFIPSTAEGLGTTVNELASLTPTEQLFFIRRFFEEHPIGSLSTLEALYTTVFTGRPQPDVNTVLFSRPSRAYELNSGLDLNGDGTITTGEATTRVATFMFGGIAAVNRRLRNANTSPFVLASLTDEADENFLTAVTEYQRNNDLTVTGFFNDETGRHLFGIDQLEVCADDRFLRSRANYPLNQRNNNPGNIKKSIPTIQPWRGEVPSDNAFAQFIDAQHGTRAAYVLLRGAYFTENRLTTVEQIISRWAPQEANEEGTTSNYIRTVAGSLGIEPTDRLNIVEDDEQLITMFTAMARWEGGPTFEPYPESMYREALVLYNRYNG